MKSTPQQWVYRVMPGKMRWRWQSVSIHRKRLARRGRLDRFSTADAAHIREVLFRLRFQGKCDDRQFLLIDFLAMHFVGIKYNEALAMLAIAGYLEL